MAQRLKLETIRLDGGTQPRLGIDWDVAYGYGDLIKDGAKFPPVVVFFDGSSYWLADGFHRYHGAFSADLTEISAEVIQGTIEDAQWYSFGANKSHGLMRSNDDKQRAVQAALRHPKCAGMSDNQIAKHVGVNAQTVANWRKKLEPVSSEIREMAAKTRTATRNGTTYEINTENIGKRQPTEEPKEEAAAEMKKEDAKQPTSKRDGIIQNAHFNKMAEAMGILSGCCDSLGRCNAELAAKASSAGSFTQWIKTLEASIAKLRSVKKDMERVNENTTWNSHAGDAGERFEDTPDRAARVEPHQAQAY